MTCTRAPGAGPTLINHFENWAQNVTAAPQIFFQPSSVDELVAIVKQATADNLSVRAVGSGWSFTDVMVTPGYMVNTDLLNNTLSETLTGATYPDDPIFNALTPVALTRKLYHVEAGIKIHDLYDRLESIPGGVTLNDGPGSAPQSHGYALKTLGGSGGQSITGAVSTSTHGGDDLDTLNGGTIKPLPDMVQGIHLVAPGGAEFFIQRGGAKAIVDVALLGQSMPCVASPGQIISDDDAFNAAVVAVGRMGIIYSVVLEVREQYVLLENNRTDTWSNVSSLVLLGQSSASGTTIADMRAANRFLQVIILPYANSGGDHTCFVTTRNEVAAPASPAFGQAGKNLFNYACDAPPVVISALVAGMIGALGTAIAAFLLIPIFGEFLAAADIALMALLTPLALPGVTIGDYLAGAENILSQLGLFGLASSLVNSILSSSLSTTPRQDLSFKSMDTYDYGSQCYKALSLEVAFNADDTTYLGFIQAVFNDIQTFASQNILVGAYISLRYCAGSDALLAIEQWPNTVCIEIASLAGLTDENSVLGTFEQEANNRGGTVHWGQLNSRTRADVEAKFPKIHRWRTTLERVSVHGGSGTFDNVFCFNHGLEAFGAAEQVDLSYVTPLLLSADASSQDISYLAYLLGPDQPNLSYLAPLLLSDDEVTPDLSYLVPLLN
jgi:FAD/FMN-containing dehydrogenase